MLRIHILNVGHGDSIVLDYTGSNGIRSFAVIDSNSPPNKSPRALNLLKSLGATDLSFVAITHPHADHYMGMRAILEHYSGHIDALYTFPIRQDRESIKKLIGAYKAAAAATDDPGIHSRLVELGYVLKLASTAARSWEDPTGTLTTLSAPGFDGVRISTLLPPAKVKGQFFEKILNGSVEPEKESLNELSMAFLVEYAGKQVILAGDGTYSNWIYQYKKWAGANINISPVAVKLPHHGSKHDCNPLVQNILFGTQDKQQVDAIACVSANGKTHPAPEVLDEMVSRGIKPYCTNLARRCGANHKNLVTSPQLDPVLLRLLNSAAIDADSSSQPCQGDIVIELTEGQSMQVSTEYKNLCALRGDFAFLGGVLQ